LTVQAMAFPQLSRRRSATHPDLIPSLPTTALNSGLLRDWPALFKHWCFCSGCDTWKRVRLFATFSRVLEETVCRVSRPSCCALRICSLLTHPRCGCQSKSTTEHPSVWL